ncbi:hypothetical protein PG993_000832 [Apiospora rasikravindrae]|uniref:Uncharacterized protein n=1 Tax=Apiospora rasikravindrae TaxID=990691 RepID=A0ABR1U9P1_9PEZI
MGLPVIDAVLENKIKYRRLEARKKAIERLQRTAFTKLNVYDKAVIGDAVDKELNVQVTNIVPRMYPKLQFPYRAVIEYAIRKVFSLHPSLFRSVGLGHLSVQELFEYRG